MWTRLTTLVCVTWTSTVPLLAQHGAAPPRPTDSMQLARAAIGNAHRLQSDFERRRRAALPVHQPSSDTPCEERVGRLCYWHRESDSAVAEPPSITRERDRLIDRFSRLVRLAPDDPWVMGQYVRYLVEGGYDSSAIVAARACASTPWWCAALRGFALQSLQRYADAEVAFDSALNAMPVADRCAWNDLSLLLTDDERDRYSALPCDRRADFERRFWQLADPSYIVPGNDRRTEHFARMVMVTLSRDAQNAYGLSWGGDLRELVVRYGAPTSYNTLMTNDTRFERPVIGHDREPSYHFAALATQSDTTRWELRADRARERYAPRYLTRIDDFPAQFAMFKRGDSALVVAMYADTGSAAHAEPLLGITDLYGVIVTSDSADGPRVRRTRAAWRSVVAGVERYDTTTRRLERARVWLAPPVPAPGAPALSTLLLYAPASDSDDVGSLDDAVRHALTNTDLGRARRVGLYWEMYGASNADSATALSVTVLRTDGGAWRWLARALRLVPANAPLNVGWHDVPSTPGGVSKTIVLDLSQLTAGNYRIEVAAGPDTAHRTVATRDIRLR